MNIKQQVNAFLIAFKVSKYRALISIDDGRLNCELRIPIRTIS